MTAQKSLYPIPHPPDSSSSKHPPPLALDLDPYASTAEYYGSCHSARKVVKSRTYSARALAPESTYDKPKRRTSADDGYAPRKYLLNVDETLSTLLKNEDTDHNVQITIEDKGPKTMALGTLASGGYRRYHVRGTYMLSNLLQELTMAQRHNRKQIVLDELRLNENPVTRMARLIQEEFWNNLTRHIDGSNIGKVARDDKAADKRPRIYIPRGAPEQHEYYTRVAREHPQLDLDVQWLADDPSDPDYVRDLNDHPGLLAIAMEPCGTTPDGHTDYCGLPFVVPGGRFNELYGWDSYMETLGLLIHGRVDLARSMVRHFCFCIRHYGKILNANRTYYLCRSQPPFLTDMALRVYDHIRHDPASLDFLRDALLAAIKDYYTTWMALPRYDAASGLSCYRPDGRGVPPETEATHFVNKLEPLARKYNMSYDEFIHAYNHADPRIHEPELDDFFRHDRSVRESGHDTSYRLEGVSADLATVDLNSCLYKYEADIARTIRALFADALPIPPAWRAPGQPAIETSAMWDRRATRRRNTMSRLMWSDDTGMFFDYNVVDRKQTGYESATTFWAMWAGAATPHQAAQLAARALPRFEARGGLAAGSRASRGPISLHRPNRQWDYPYGWAPQQILAWTGFLRYGFDDVAQRLAYRWLYMCTRSFVEYNGVVVEKYDVTRQGGAHIVTAEYGNQGAGFKGAPTEGFGWVNASYIYGLQIVNVHMQRALGALVSWDEFRERVVAGEGEAGPAEGLAEGTPASAAPHP